MGCSSSTTAAEVSISDLLYFQDPNKYHVVYIRGADKQAQLSKLMRRGFQFVPVDLDELVAEANNKAGNTAPTSDSESPAASPATPENPEQQQEQQEQQQQQQQQQPSPTVAESKSRIDLLIEAIQQNPLGTRILIKGFPTSVEEFRAWQATDFYANKVVSVLVLTPDDVASSTPEQTALTIHLIKQRLNRFIPDGLNLFQTFTFGHKALVSSFHPIVSPLTPHVVSGSARPAPKAEVNTSPVPVASVLCVIGGPGSSKKLQRDLLAQHGGYVPISVGALLKAAGERDPQIKQAIEHGVNVPAVETVCNIVCEAIEDHVKAGSTRLVIEGFPRTQAQLAQFLTSTVSKVICEGMVYCQATPEVLRSRLIARRDPQGSGNAADAEAKTELTDMEAQQMYAFEGEFIPMIDHIEQEKSVPLVRVDDMGGPHITFTLIRRALTGLGIPPATAPNAEEVTYAMIKPDAVQAGYVEDIIKDIARAGFKILMNEQITFTREQAETFYEEHRGRSFYEPLIQFMTSGPVVALALSKRSAISEWRRLAGPTDPRRARCLSPGSIRAIYGIDGTRNAVHGSDSVFSANRELQLVFGQRFADSKLNKISRGYRIILAGGPASGKGTQAELLRDKLGVVHISTGELLRSEKKRGTDLGLKAAQYFENGQLVPDDVMIPLVLDRISRPDCQAKGWMLDGFPRTGAQADALVKAGLKADIFILLDVEDQTLVERVTGRRTDKNTGKIYHLKYNPPPPDVKPEDLEQRADDTEEKIVYRIQTFKANVDAIRGAFSPIMAIVDGNRDKQSIFEDILARIPSVL